MTLRWALVAAAAALVGVTGAVPGVAQEAECNQHAANENLRIGTFWSGVRTYAGLMARLRAEWDAAVRAPPGRTPASALQSFLRASIGGTLLARRAGM